MSVCFLDIETASRPDWLARKAVDEKVEPGLDTVLWTAKHAGDGARSPWTGQVVCWAMAGAGGEPFGHVVADEGAVLASMEKWLADLATTTIVAHNGFGFDFPFVRQRALTFGMPELAKRFTQDKPWSGRLIDTSDQSWMPRPPHASKGWEYSLNAACRMLGIERPDTLPGADVPLAWYEQRYEEILTHCIDDVRTLREVYWRLSAGRV